MGQRVTKPLMPATFLTVALLVKIGAGLVPIPPTLPQIVAKGIFSKPLGEVTTKIVAGIKKRVGLWPRKPVRPGAEHFFPIAVIMQIDP